MAIQRPADARPVAPYEFRGFNGLIGHQVTAWRPGFVEFTLKVRPELCNANGLLHGGVLMTLLDGASGFACTFNDTATTRRLSVTLAFTTQFIKAAREGDTLTILGDWTFEAWSGARITGKKRFCVRWAPPRNVDFCDLAGSASFCSGSGIASVPTRTTLAARP